MVHVSFQRYREWRGGIHSEQGIFLPCLTPVGHQHQVKIGPNIKWVPTRSQRLGRILFQSGLPKDHPGGLPNYLSQCKVGLVSLSKVELDVDPIQESPGPRRGYPQKGRVAQQDVGPKLLQDNRWGMDANLLPPNGDSNLGEGWPET